jgi:hypothetical protein
LRSIFKDLTHLLTILHSAQISINNVSKYGLINIAGTYFLPSLSPPLGYTSFYVFAGATVNNFKKPMNYLPYIVLDNESIESLMNEQLDTYS